MQLGGAAEVARDRRHEVGEDRLVPFARGVEQGEEAELAIQAGGLRSWRGAGRRRAAGPGWA